MDDLSLHSIEVVEIGTKGQQFIDVQIEGILFMDAGESGVAVGADY
jgi:hypothetical protein